MTRILPLLAGLAIVIPSAVLRGLWTDRWGPGTIPAAAAANLERLPFEIGDWQGRTIPTDPAPRDAKAAGHLMRRYENRVNGQTCSIYLACGRAGPLSVHTPEVCYNGTGYELTVGPLRVPAETAATTATEFWTASFEKQDAAPVELRVFWAWNGGSGWQAPVNPRLAFSRAPVLYKLYVLRETVPGDGRLEEDPARDFLRRLLPEVDRILLSDQ